MPIDENTRALAAAQLAAAHIRNNPGQTYDDVLKAYKNCLWVVDQQHGIKPDPKS